MCGNARGRLMTRLNDEHGSMVVALLAVIVASGLMMSIAASAVAGHRGVNFDRDHVRVVQGADAGIEEVIYKLGHPDPAQRLTPGPGGVPWQGPFTAGNATYRYKIDPWPAEAGSWRITSEGTLSGTQRTVSAIVAQPKLFQLAAFADSHMVLRGGNSANSYNASTWNTGEGNLGSN